MSGDYIYWDYNASAPLCDAAKQAMLPLMDLYGNPSSIHGPGRAGWSKIFHARQALARLCRAEADNIVFTSGASEANNTVLTPHWRRDGAALALTKLIVSAVEHPSVLSAGAFPPASREIVGVDDQGRVRLPDLSQMLERAAQEGHKILVSIMAANNETGIIQPIEEIGKIIREYGGIFHVDAVQMGARLPIDIHEIGADAITLSAHKMGGPQGVGAIIYRSDNLQPRPLLTGGGQEAFRRAGTENLLAIAGFGAAAQYWAGKMAALGTNAQEKAVSSDPACTSQSIPSQSISPQSEEIWRNLRDEFEMRLLEREPNAVIFGSAGRRLCNTSCFAVPGLPAERALIGLDLAGIAVSSGSACSSGKVGRSHVLAAMGVDENLSANALRVSFGPHNHAGEIDLFFKSWRELRRTKERALAQATV